MAFDGLTLSKQWSVMYVLGTIKERNKNKTDITNKEEKLYKDQKEEGK